MVQKESNVVIRTPIEELLDVLKLIEILSELFYRLALWIVVVFKRVLEEIIKLCHSSLCKYRPIVSYANPFTVDVLKG
jgi:hypothetical protein